MHQQYPIRSSDAADKPRKYVSGQENQPEVGSSLELAAEAHEQAPGQPTSDPEVPADAADAPPSALPPLRSEEAAVGANDRNAAPQ